MVDELSSLLDMFQSFKKSGRSATLTMSTKGGEATKVKLEVELDDAKPSPPLSSPSTSAASAPSLPGCQAAKGRHRPRGSEARRAKANARAARHRAFQALPFYWRKCSAPSSTPDRPPPRRPLHIHPSPSDENRRQILTVDRKAGSQPTFSQLDGDGDLPPDCPRCQRQIDLHQRNALKDPRTAHLLTTLLLAPTSSHVTIVINVSIGYVAKSDLV